MVPIHPARTSLNANAVPVHGSFSAMSQYVVIPFLCPLTPRSSTMALMLLLAFVYRLRLRTSA